jgi:DDE superfamily endonuclease
MLLLLMQDEPGSQRFKDRLNQEGRWRQDRQLPRMSLPDPETSPWAILYAFGDDGALITATGFDHNTFRHILDLFQPLYDKFTPCTRQNDGHNYKKRRCHKRGRKRMVTAEACLGLVLASFRFKGAQWILQGWFGFTYGKTNVWLRFGRRMLFKALYKHPECVVQFPSDDEIKKLLMEVVQGRHSALTNVYSVGDGLKLHFQNCKDLTEQSMFYNGWQHGHYITNLFVFAADGRIINCLTNVPGSVHDSTIAVWGGTYRKLRRIYERTGGVCCEDSAFAATEVPYLLRSAPQDPQNAKTQADIRRQSEATSLRQAAEWGMRAIQGSMPRLTETIKYEKKGERRRVMKLVPLLYNLRLARVGLNQLANTYVLHRSKDAGYYIQFKKPKKATK